MADFNFVRGSGFVAQLVSISPEELKETLYDRDCPICHDVFGPETTDAVQLPCHHVFCRRCLLPWISEHGSNQRSCPKCRQTLHWGLELSPEYQPDINLNILIGFFMHGFNEDGSRMVSRLYRVHYYRMPFHARWRHPDPERLHRIIHDFSGFIPNVAKAVKQMYAEWLSSQPQAVQDSRGDPLGFVVPIMSLDQRGSSSVTIPSSFGYTDQLTPPYYPSEGDLDRALEIFAWQYQPERPDTDDTIVGFREAIAGHEHEGITSPEEEIDRRELVYTNWRSQLPEHLRDLLPHILRHDHQSLREEMEILAGRRAYEHDLESYEYAEYTIGRMSQPEDPTRPGPCGDVAASLHLPDRDMHNGFMNPLDASDGPTELDLYDRMAAVDALMIGREDPTAIALTTDEERILLVGLRRWPRNYDHFRDRRRRSVWAVEVPGISETAFELRHFPDLPEFPDEMPILVNIVGFL